MKKIEGKYEYYAFISYKRDDEEWAKWLQNKLEHYRLPSNLNGRPGMPREVRPVFRDTSELTPGNLSQQILHALEQSKFLIVVCSPRSAQSEWVNREVDTFVSMGRTENVIPFIIEGQPFAKNAAEECFPQVLRQVPDEQEILGANINEMGRDAAAVKVVARMFGVKFDTLWQRYEREQRRRRRLFLAGILGFVLAVVGVAGWIWHQNVKLAEANWQMLENRARFVAEKSSSLTDEGDAYTARLLALAVLPEDLEHPSVPFTIEAERALIKASRRSSMSFDATDGSYVHQIAYSPDGRLLASAHGHGGVRLWDMQTGGLLRALGQQDMAVESLSFSDDGQRLVVCTSDSIEIWHVASGQRLRAMAVADGSGMEYTDLVMFTRDGRYVLAAGYEAIQVWDAETGGFIHSVDIKDGNVTSMAVSPGGDSLVIGTLMGSVLIWDILNAKELTILASHQEASHCETVESVDYSSDGSRIVYSRFDGMVCVRDAASKRLLSSWKVGGEREVYARFSPDGRDVAVSYHGAVTIFDAETHEEKQTFSGTGASASGLVYSPDGSHLAVSYADGRITVFDLQGEACMMTLNGGRSVYTTAVSLDGRYIAAGCEDGSVIVWNAVDGHTVAQLKGHTGPVPSMAFSPDGRVLATASYDTTIRLWDVDTWTESAILAAHQRRVNAVSFSPDGRLLLSGSSDNTIKLWDMDSRSVRYSKEKGRDGVLGVKFSPDGQHFVTTKWYQRAYFWDVESGEEVSLLAENDEYVFCVAYSPDGKCIATGHGGTVRLWDAGNGQLLRTMNTIKGYVRSLAFRGDGKCLAAVTYNENFDSFSLFDVDTGESLYGVVDEKTRMRNVEFFPDGRRLAVLFSDGRIDVWDFPPLQDLIRETRELLKDRPLTPEERRKYYLE